jgi:hypothetical protein
LTKVSTNPQNKIKTNSFGENPSENRLLFSYILVSYSITYDNIESGSTGYVLVIVYNSNISYGHNKLPLLTIYNKNLKITLYYINNIQIYYHTPENKNLILPSL